MSLCEVIAMCLSCCHPSQSGPPESPPNLVKPLHHDNLYHVDKDLRKLAQRPGKNPRIKPLALRLEKRSLQGPDRFEFSTEAKKSGDQPKRQRRNHHPCDPENTQVDFSLSAATAGAESYMTGYGRANRQRIRVDDDDRPLTRLDRARTVVRSGGRENGRTPLRPPPG